MLEPMFKSMTLTEAREAVRLCNSYNLLPKIIGLCSNLDVADWLRLLGENWTGCDNISQFAGELMGETPLSYVLDGEHALRQHLMDEREADHFAGLPDSVTAWRGCYAHNKCGLSWSLERATAERFPFLHRYRAEGQPLLVRAEVRKGDIIALKLDRDEAEIITASPKISATSHIKFTGMSGSEESLHLFPPPDHNQHTEY